MEQQPVFEDIGEALDYMDEREAQLREEFEAEAAARIEAAQNDPRGQFFFMRGDRNTIIKDEQEYTDCQLKGIALKTIPYKQAVQVLKDADARVRNERKNKAKKKAARKARKRNR